MKKDICLLFLDTSRGSVDLKESYKEYYKSIINNYNYVMVYTFNTSTSRIIGNPINGIDDSCLSFYGGSYISCALETALVEIIKHKAVENRKKTYDVIVISDFDNWCEDNEKAAAFIKEMSSKLSGDDSFKLIKADIPHTPNSLSTINIIRKEKYELDIMEYVEDLNVLLKSKRTLYEIAHKLNHIKTYTFKANEGETFKVNEMVACNTSKGQTFGRVIRIREVNMYDSDYEKYKKLIKLQ